MKSMKISFYKKAASFLRKFEGTLGLFSVVPNKLKIYLLISILLGLVLPFFDYLFAGILQHSLYVLKVLDVPTKILENYLGIDFNLTILALLAIGLSRAALAGYRQMLGALSLSVFVTEFRKKILEKYIIDSDYDSGAATSTFSDIVPQVGNSIYHFSLMLSSLVSLVVILGVSLSISTNATLFIIFIVFIFSFLMKYMSSKIQIVGKKIDKNSEQISSKFIEGIKNHFLIKLYGKTLEYVDETDRLLDIYQSNYVTYSYYSLLGTALPIASATIVAVLVLSLSQLSIITLPPNKFLILIYMLMRAAQTLGELSNSFTIASLSLPMLDRLRILNVNHFSPKNLQYKTNAGRLLSIDKIRLSNLSYNLQRDGRLIINDLDEEINKGDIVVIKGESGAGKSTLISLISGLLKPTSGSIIFNDQYLADDININIREKIGYVGVDPFFINASVRDNLLYLTSSPENISDESIWETLQSCNLSDFVKTLTERLDYVITDTVKFSAGQKQRFLLARALLRSPDILLLDEATSNLDTKNELEIFQNLKVHLKNKITIIVTHRNTLDSLATKLIEL